MRAAGSLRAYWRLFLPLVAAGIVVGVGSANADGASSAAPTIHHAPLGADVVLSHHQAQLVAWETARRPTPTWNMGTWLKLRGRLDAAALEAALASVLARHTSLRTTLVRRDALWAPVIAESRSLEVPVIDLRNVAEAARPQETSRLLQEELLTPFVLGEGPLVRAKRIAVDDDVSVVVVTLHQLVVDLGSLKTLEADIVSGYCASIAQGGPGLSPLAFQYSDYAASERAWIDGDGAAMAAHACRRLAGAHPLELPVDRPRPARSPDTTVARFELTRHEVEALGPVRKRVRATPFMLFLTALGLALSRRLGVDDVVVSTPVDVRPQELRENVGRFTNWPTCRVDVSGDPTGADLIARVRTEVFDMHDVSKVPANVVVGGLDHPFRRVVLNGPNFVQAPGPAVAVDGVMMERLSLALPEFARTELTVTATGNNDGGIDVVLVGCADLFDQTTIASMAHELHASLIALASHSDRPISTALIST